MDAAASVVSLIQFTITGLIVIRQTFSSIREGPEVVTDTVKNVHHLLHILKRLESSHAVKESQDEVLSDVLKSCHADVTRMVQKLEKLDFKASDKMGFKLWRSVKSALKEKELMDFRVKMHRYSSSLATFITIEDSDKLFEMNRKMDDAHRFIQKELLCLSEKCDRIEVKCDEVGATARNPRLQGTRIVGPMRQIIQNQLQQLVGQHGLSYSQAEIPIDFQQAGAIEGLASSLSTIAATKNPRARADQLSNLAKNWESDIEFECDATRSIVKDITALVEGLKTLTAAVAMLETQPQIGKSTTGQQIQGMLLYPELRYTPDALLSPPIENQVSTETGYNVPEDRHWDLAEVLANSRSLQDFFSRDRIRLTVVVDKPAMVNRQTLARLLQWESDKLNISDAMD